MEYHEIAKVVITIFNVGESIPCEDHATDKLWMVGNRQVGYDSIPLRAGRFEDEVLTDTLWLIEIESSVPALMTADGTALLDEQLTETSMWDTFSDQYDELAALVNRYFESLRGVTPPSYEFHIVLKSWLDTDVYQDGYIYCCEIIGQLDFDKLATAVKP